MLLIKIGLKAGSEGTGLSQMINLC